MSLALIFRRILFLGTCTLSGLSAQETTINGPPNTSSREEISNGEWAVTADFLAWFASEEVASIWADVITIGDNTSSWEPVNFNFDWDYGFRIGAGYDLAYDQWDTALSWTWFRTNSSHSIPYNPNATINPEFFAAFLTYDIPKSMDAQWSILLNMFDLELGKNYAVSKDLSLRPFIALKSGWINQSIHVHYYNLTNTHSSTGNDASEHLKNNFWGVGPLGGINTTWKVRNFKSHFFSLFGNFSMATLWGEWDCSDVYKNTLPKTSTIDMKVSAIGALMFRGFMGIGWDVDIQKGKQHFSTNLGYEMQIWLDQLRIATFQLQRLHNDLTLQGITFNCRFDF